MHSETLLRSLGFISRYSVPAAVRLLTKRLCGSIPTRENLSVAQSAEHLVSSCTLQFITCLGDMFQFLNIFSLSLIDQYTGTVNLI